MTCPGSPSPTGLGRRRVLCTGSVDLPGCKHYDWHAQGEAPEFKREAVGWTCPKREPLAHPLVLTARLHTPAGSAK
jgi:hypothetical protein